MEHGNSVSNLGRFIPDPSLSGKKDARETQPLDFKKGLSWRDVIKRGSK